MGFSPSYLDSRRNGPPSGTMTPPTALSGLWVEAGTITSYMIQLAATSERSTELDSIVAAVEFLSDLTIATVELASNRKDDVTRSWTVMWPECPGHEHAKSARPERGSPCGSARLDDLMCASENYPRPADYLSLKRL